MKTYNDDMEKIECVIMDWAGTAVDYGCFAPVAAFVECFKAMGLTVTPAETRAHMGLTKIEEIRALFAIDHVRAEFAAKYGREYGDDDVQLCYKGFEKALFATLEGYSKPMPGVVETMASLRANSMKTGSTTGYTKAMMDVVMPAAQRQGYTVDCCVTSDGLPAGRPKPYMVYQNMCSLAVESPKRVVKVGDTIADIREGKNAGAWSVGVILGSNEMGLTQAETAALTAAELNRRMNEVRLRMYAAGADFVVDDITALPALIDCINKRMAQQ